MTNNEAGQIDNRIQEDLKTRLQEKGDHMQVQDKNGEHVGTVDSFDGEQLKLTKDDSTDGQHHFVQLSQVESMDNVAVYLNVTREDVLK
ncbi:DUF2171 domain-containing protein [Deinococcus sp. Marseille-Q6407]|uniref:DUF2171 domain-containing protein n=1 Tax=Deinococcus sp. Marseille-Q6407 TaxID=2969223 RepID=UPI0021BEE507|nr:DUF2171 domain-containing protein [Deinococcus sp. Marseille-Q6407]